MAIDVCSEISSAGIISPRISFSHDLSQTDAAEDQQRRLDSSLLDSTSDFDFCIGNTFIQELSSADELFSNGKILPIQIKKQTHQPESTVVPSPPPPPPPAQIGNHESCTEKKRLKEFLSMSLDADDDDEKPISSKSFWQFKRSSSLNSVSTPSKSLIRSLQFLSRSNSTGSAPKPTVPPKESQKQNNNFQRQPSVSRKSKVSSSGTYYSYYNNTTTQKPPLKKNCSGSHNYANNGVRISPVLNIPPPYISNATVSLFGFGSLFCNGKIKKKKR